MRDVMLVFHFIGLAMAMGAGFSNLFLGAVAAKLEPAERGNFMSKTTVLARMGQTGLGLLLLSGFYLITPYWSTLGDRPLLVTKLSLVMVLIILVTILSIMVRKAKKQRDFSILKKVKPVGMVNFFIGIAIVVLAVLIFH